MIVFALLACVALCVLLAFAGSLALAGACFVLVVWLIALTIRMEILGDTVRRLQTRLHDLDVQEGRPWNPDI